MQFGIDTPSTPGRYIDSPLAVDVICGRGAKGSEGERSTFDFGARRLITALYPLQSLSATSSRRVESCTSSSSVFLVVPRTTNVAFSAKAIKRASLSLKAFAGTR